MATSLNVSSDVEHYNVSTTKVFVAYRNYSVLTQKVFVVETLYHFNLLCYVKCSTSLLTVRHTLIRQPLLALPTNAKVASYVLRRICTHSYSVMPVQSHTLLFRCKQERFPFTTGVDLCSKCRIKAKHSSKTSAHHVQSHL